MIADARLYATALPFMFAESTFEGVKSSILGEALVSIAALLIIGQIVWSGIEKIRGGTPQKREVTFAENFATQQQHAELRAEVAKIDHERRVSTAALHEKIEALGDRIDDRIDKVPERVIALLNETKQLHRS